MTLTVIGVDSGPPPPGALDALRTATVVVGAARHLAVFPPPAGAEVVELGALRPGLDRVSTSDGSVVVLASGDPGFFGVVRVLRERGLSPRVLPATSSVTRAFARLGRSWDDVSVVSAHGRSLRPAVNVCRARAATAVLTAPGAGPAEIGAALRGWRRHLVVAEDLDGPHERLSTMDPAEAAGREWSEPNVLLCLREPEAVPAAGWYAGGEPSPPPGGWALADAAFAHRDGMLTKSEVRALALARLAPRPGTLVWDVGAGSGSVAVECARLGAAALAVERDPYGCRLVAGNASAHGVDVRLVPGTAPAVLAGLPEPDAVFVGGGGPDVVAAVAATAAERVVVALAALDRLASTRDALRAAGFTVGGCQLAASRLADLPDGTTRLAATNPVLLVWGQRRLLETEPVARPGTQVTR